MENLESLNAEDLIKIRKQIDERILELSKKSESKTFGDLKVGDQIFVAQLQFYTPGGSTFNTINENYVIERIDSFDDKLITLKLVSRIGNPNIYQRFELQTNNRLVLDESEDLIAKNVYLFSDIEKFHSSFFTLSPQTWREDIILAYEKYFKCLYNKLYSDIEIYQNQLNSFLKL